MTKKIFVSHDNTITLVCPKCQKVQTTDVSRFMGIDTVVKMKCRCSCGHLFFVNLDRRRYIRKGIHIPGVCIFGEGNSKLLVIITDISKAGLKLKMNTPHRFCPGDSFLLEFNLDDRFRSLIKKDVTVRSIKDIYLGVEFNSSEHYGKLGPYIMFK